ncbi:MAG: hypothetical protein ACKVLB_03685 [Burkholderiales bacterium]|jgi:hypothetical protein
MYEAAVVVIDLMVIIPAIFVIGFILWWYKHDKEAYLQGKLSYPRKRNAQLCCALIALICIWVIFIEMQAYDEDRIQGNTITGEIIYK